MVICMIKDQMHCAMRSCSRVIYSEKGALVRSSVIKAGSTIAFMDVSDVYAGEYFLVCSDKNQNTVKKIVVQH